MLRPTQEDSSLAFYEDDLRLYFGESTDGQHFTHSSLISLLCGETKVPKVYLVDTTTTINIALTFKRPQKPLTQVLVTFNKNFQGTLI